MTLFLLCIPADQQRERCSEAATLEIIPKETVYFRVVYLFLAPLCILLHSGFILHPVKPSPDERLDRLCALQAGP